MNWKQKGIGAFATVIWAVLLVILFVPDVIKEQYRDHTTRQLKTKLLWQIQYVWGKWKDDYTVLIRKVSQL